MKYGKNTGIRQVLVLGMLGVILSSCTGQKQQTTEISHKQGVCMIDKTSVRAEPDKKGKWMSSLGLGETVEVAGEPQADPNDAKTKYIQVKLSDGNTGYVSTYCLVIDAKPAVMKEDAKVYKRPDLLAGTDKIFKLLELVAVQEERDGWVHVIGEKKNKKGWIPTGTITQRKEDVITAVLINKAVKEQKKQLTSEAFAEIEKKLPFPNNPMIGIYKGMKFSAADSVEEEIQSVPEKTIADETLEQPELMDESENESESKERSKYD